MAYSVHLRVHADLLGVARVMRLLKRYAVIAAEVAVERLAGREVTNVRGTLRVERNAKALAAALFDASHVIHAVILDDTRVVAEFLRAGR